GQFFRLLFCTKLPPPISSLFPYTTLFRSGTGSPDPRRHLGNSAGAYGAGRDSARAIRTDRARIPLDPAGAASGVGADAVRSTVRDRKSTRLNSSHVKISYAVFCLKKKKLK